MGRMDVEGLRQAARACLSPSVFAFLDDAAGEGITARRNETVFRERSLVPRVGRDVSDVDTTTTVLSGRVTAPIGIAPLPRLAAVHEEAERGLATAAASRGVVFCAATNSSVALEDLAVENARQWFQLYAHPDGAVTADLVARAGSAGYEAVVLTVDRPVPGAKKSEARKSTSPADVPNLARYGQDAVRHRYDPAFTYTDLEALCRASPLPVVVKGVLHADDARLAVDHGAAAVWVSNHGGRQLDHVVASLEALEEITGAVGDRVEVYLDGGVRRGLDVLVALALGADTVFVGRPAAYALAVDGARGVEALLGRLVVELEQAMALTGADDVRRIDRSMVR